MSESVKLLKGIMKTSGWTQEQVAMKLGVSFPTMNAWVNGKTKPRAAMKERIRRLYLAQDITKDMEPTFVTLVNVPNWLKVGDAMTLEKEQDNDYDDEAIIATKLELSDDDGWWEDSNNEIFDEDGAMQEVVGGDDEIEEIQIVGNIKIRDCPEIDSMYVANSISTVVRGTCSAGRIYDRFKKTARAQVCFIFHKMAIARVVEWNYEEGGK